MKNNILVVAVHPDDETLGCGGTLLKHKANGDKIHWLICTTLNKNNSYYVFPLQVCKMINNITIPSKNVGEFIFKDFRDDELRMSEVFEKFVRNFYATEQKIFRVKKERIKIDAQGEQKFLDLMPIW